MVQLMLFEKTEETLLREEFKKVKESSEKVRRKQFADIGELKKICFDLKDRLDLIERFICKNG